MKLSRIAVFLLGFALMLLLFFINRVWVYRNSEFTYGVLVCPPELLEETREVELTLFYYVEMHEYKVTIHDVPQDVNRQVIVRYPKDNPEKGRLYTVFNFWGVSAFFLTIPLIPWLAFVFTFLRENEHLKVKFIRKKPHQTDERSSDS